MAFTGKATYDDSDSIHEDVSDLVTINSKLATPFLDFIGTSGYAAVNTKHEWIEDSAATNVSALTEELTATSETTDITVTDYTKFRVGDIILIDDELLLVTVVDSGGIDVTRGYGGTTDATHVTASVIWILGNAALEGDDADAALAANRSRVANYTQIIRSRTISVSDTAAAVSMIGISNEYEHQKALAVRECLRSLECFAILGRDPSSTPLGSSTVRRSMNGLYGFVSTSAFNASSAALTETFFNTKLQQMWENGAESVDFALVPSYQKMVISGFKRALQNFAPDDGTDVSRTLYYQTDFQEKPIRLILSRWVPTDEIVLGDSSKINIVPLKGMSFYHKPLAVSGDYQKGFVQGEYTMEVRHEECVGRIYGLATS
jgi:hypothetical protein